MKVFWLEPTNWYELSLRRYTATEYELRDDGEKDWEKPIRLACPLIDGKYSYHTVSVVLDRIQSETHPTSGDLFPHDDPRWPAQCGCGFAFRDRDEWQVNYHLLYSGALDGQLYTLRTAPIGAMWDAHWMQRTGPDGITLVVKTPGGDWMVDSEATNCTDPAANHGGQRTHYCWCRHGDPRTGDVHVDKDGPTCGAGAGSIGIGTPGTPGYYHGHLHHGHLTEC